MLHPTSTEVAARIEELYGAERSTLELHAQDQPPGMLSALLTMHDDLAFAERSIAFHRERLAQLVHPERLLGAHEVTHVLDCARRLAEAVAVRDTQAKTLTAVLQSLGRVTAPEPGPETAPCASAALAPGPPAASPARSR
ncbi:hypothetical protein ACFUEM_25215 [Streptomyces anulatus]|uniref:hypothetical protein n=1 Tax=Streptomyces anulatus TaxID=1892 RepID=UPI0035D7DC34